MSAVFSFRLIVQSVGKIDAANRLTVVGCVHVQEELGHYSQVCEDAYTEANRSTEISNKLWLDSPWKNFFTDRDPRKLEPTGVSVDTIEHILHVFSSEPGADFNIHPGNYLTAVTMPGGSMDVLGSWLSFPLHVGYL